MGIKGTRIRYQDDVELVVFYLHHDRANPAATLSGSNLSVGTMRTVVEGKIADSRSRNPLDNRHDFDLNDPESLDAIEEMLYKMIEKCERRR